MRPTASDKLIRAQLSRILQSPEFFQSPRCSTLLRFLVDEALRGGEIKESLIGVHVFGRSPGWDPQRDSVVRTNATRLRQRLERFYINHGEHDPLRIVLQPGSYFPTFVVYPNATEPCPGAADANGEVSSEASIAIGAEGLRQRVTRAAFLAAGSLLFVWLTIVVSTSAYGQAILAFCLTGVFVVAAYSRWFIGLPAARVFVALFLIAAASYIASASTMAEVQSTIINASTLSTSPLYVMVTGLKFIPLFVLVLGQWVILGFGGDSEFWANSAMRRAYLLAGIAFITAEFVALDLASGDDRILAARLPGSGTIVMGSLVVLAANIGVWLAGWSCFQERKTAGRQRLFWRGTLAYLLIAFASFFVDREHNRINRYYLDARWPVSFKAANPDAIKNASGLLRGKLKYEVGAELTDLLANDADFHRTLREGVFYRQFSDEAFQLSAKSVVFGYKPQRGAPFVTIRFPQELADAFRFVPLYDRQSR